MEPGDMLYLPPGVAHHGVALEDSLSISVGYRAPTYGDLLSGFYGEAIAEQTTERFYSDPDLALQSSPGELSEQSRSAIRSVIRDIAIDDASIDRWFGRYITDVRPGHHIPEPEQTIKPEDFQKLLSAYGELQRSEYCRYSYIRDDNGTLRLYVAGEEFILHGAGCKIAELLADRRHLESDELLQAIDKPGVRELLTELYNLGCIYFADE